MGVAVISGLCAGAVATLLFWWGYACGMRDGIKIADDLNDRLREFRQDVLRMR